ncbi:MAG: hypothetical protein IJV33_07720 [Bacteroidaceae bacterium]|nr:hypothetical protein [Bacteroidaceae bacterium]
MNYQELAKLKESREYKAAEALTDALNTMGWSPKKFAMSVALQHRMLQQELARTMVATIRVMASDDYGYDDRNRGSHEAAKKMVESGILDEIYLPFI